MEDDPVVNEANVYMSHALAEQLCILQYPLRPAHMPYPIADLAGARVRMQKREMELDISIQPHGENYSESRGEMYAKTGDGNGHNAEPLYKSGRFDKHTLSSEPAVTNLKRYVAGVFKDGELHLAPVHAVMKLKPSLTHLDRSSEKSASTGGALSGGETEEEEGEEEEARPVQVKLKRGGKATQQESSKEEEPWVELKLCSLESDEATEERSFLFAAEYDHSGVFELGRQPYLDMLCPVRTDDERAAPVPPGGLHTLAQLKALPLPQQVKELLRSSVAVQYSRLCSLLTGGEHSDTLLDIVQKCGVLVQGCWVASSEVVFPEEADLPRRSSRDFILMSFARNRIVLRKDIKNVVKIPHDELIEILQSVAEQRVSIGWEFKLPTDESFIQRFSTVVLHQEHKWRLREKELTKEFTPPQDTNKPSHSIVVQALSGDEVVKMAEKKVRPLPLENMATVVPSTALLEALRSFCKSVVGNGVIALSEVKDKLLLRQTTASDQDPLRLVPRPGSFKGIPESLLESTLREIGAIAVGQAAGRPLFALGSTGSSPSDEYRKVILQLFQTSKNIRKKQVMDEISKLGLLPDQKILSAVFKDLCHSKGSLWYLLGT